MRLTSLTPLLLVCCLALAAEGNIVWDMFLRVAPSWAGGHTFKMPKHFNGVSVVDYARHDLPPVRMGERVIDLVNGIHFDDLLQDTPYEIRPPTLLLFKGYESCPGADKGYKFTQMAETKLPSRERLMIAVYDIDAAPVRAWYKFTPEMDLQKRFKAKCGSLVFVPRACDGFTEWCKKPKNPDDPPELERVGCEDYVDKCAPLVQHYDAAASGEDWVKWVMSLVEKEGEPEISPVLGSYFDQNKWMRERDEVSSDNHLRNLFLVEAFPAFTPLGYLVLPTPKKLQDFALDFWNRRKRSKFTEHWSAASTQLSFHEKPTSFVSLDQEAYTRDALANEILKPIVAEWSKIPNLELTSFYGIRSYPPGSWLRNHIDRIETHVLSITVTMAKLNETTDELLTTPESVKGLPTWPLEFIATDGEVHRHPHLPGTMILYESSKGPHGRPYHNPGPSHLGFFVHFKPKIQTAGEAKAWEDIAEYAKNNQNANTYRGMYKTSRVVEPTNPVYTKTPYGQSTGFVSSKAKGEGKKTAEKKSSYTVSIVNESDRLLDVHWIDPNTNNFVLQGSVAPGTVLTLETYPNHVFQWTEPGTKTPVPKGKFTIELGSRRYVYSAAFAASKQ